MNETAIDHGVSARSLNPAMLAVSETSPLLRSRLMCVAKSPKARAAHRYIVEAACALSKKHRKKPSVRLYARAMHRPTVPSAAAADASSQAPWLAVRRTGSRSDHRLAGSPATHVRKRSADAAQPGTTRSRPPGSQFLSRVMHARTHAE